MRLSILIPTMPGRERFLERLLCVLKPQIASHHGVEILLDDRPKPTTIGTKRNWLLQRSSADYIAFIDDDDLVATNYVELVLKALEGNPDCSELRGTITTDGKSPKPFIHTIACQEWCEKDGVYWRSPNHLNAIRRDFAIKAGFPEKNFGEDHEFSNRVKPLLKTMGQISHTIYLYQYRTRKQP